MTTPEESTNSDTEQQTKTPLILDSTTNLNLTVASALEHFLSVTDAHTSVMKGNAKGLAQDSWIEQNKHIDEFGSFLTVVAMEMAKLEGQLDQHLQSNIQGQAHSVTYASALTTAGRVAANAPSTFTSGQREDDAGAAVQVRLPREALLVFGKTSAVNALLHLTQKFDPGALSIQNVSLNTMKPDGVCIKSSSKDGLDRLKTAIETSEETKT